MDSHLVPAWFSRVPKGALVMALATSLTACDENPTNQPLGSMEITTSSTSTTFTTADGWAVKVDRFLVHIGAVNVAGGDKVLAASATPQIVDQVAPGPKQLLQATVRTARHWEEVTLVISPALAVETALIAPVTEADRDMMQREGFSLYLEASLSKEGVTKALKLGFSTNTLFKDCAGEKDGQFVRGLIVPEEGSDTADVVMDGSILFDDDLVATGALPRADAIAAADANNDGLITLTELRAVSLDVAKETGGLYGVGETEAVVDLGAFVEARARHTVTSFRTNGVCIFESRE